MYRRAMDVPGAASTPASRAGEPCPPDATVSCVTADDGTALHLRCEWRHGERSFDALVVAVPSSPDAPITAWRAENLRQPPNAPYPDWYERAVAALAALDAPRHFAFSLAATSTSARDDDDDRDRARARAVFRWTWHERPPPGSDGGPVADVGAHPANPPPARVDAPRKGAKRVGVATLHAASADASVRVFMRDAAAINAALRRDARVHERDADELRAAVDHAHDELRALADAAETRERDALTRCVLVVNEKKRRVRELEDALEAARDEVARLERRAARGADGGADGGADPDEDDGLGEDTDEEREAERREAERRRRVVKPPVAGRGRGRGRGRARAGGGRDDVEDRDRPKPEPEPEPEPSSPRKRKAPDDDRARHDVDVDVDADADEVPASTETDDVFVKFMSQALPKATQTSAGEVPRAPASARGTTAATAAAAAKGSRRGSGGGGGWGARRGAGNRTLEEDQSLGVDLFEM